MAAKTPNPAAKRPSQRRKKRGRALKEHALVILGRLKTEYPDAHCELDFENPLQLLIATILSASARTSG